MALNIGNLTANVSLTGAQQFKRQLAGLVSGVRDLGAAYLSLAGAQKAFSFAKQGAAAKDAQRAFESAGFSIEKFRQATNGMISDTKLIQKFNLAKSLGVTEEAFLTLAQVAQASAITTGQSLDYMFESAIIGAARQSPQILDNLGISIKKTGDKAAFMADLIAKGNKVIAQAGNIAESASGKYDRLAASFENTSNAAAGAFDNFVTNTMADVQSLADDWGESFTAIWNGIKAVGLAIVQMFDGVGKAVAYALAYPIVLMRKEFALAKQAVGGFLMGVGNAVGNNSLRGTGAGIRAQGIVDQASAGEFLDDFLKNFSLEKILSNFAEQFDDNSPPVKAVKQLGKTLGSLKEAVEDLVPAFVNARTSVWEDLRQQRLFEGKTEVGVGFLDFLQSVDENSAQFVKALESMEAAAKDTAKSFGQAFGDNRQGVLDNLLEGQTFDLDTGAVTGGPMSAKGRLGSGISSLLSQTASGLVKLGVTLPTSIQDVVSTLLEVGQQIVGALFDLGKSLAQDVFATSQRAGGLQRAGQRATQAAAAPFLAAALVPIGAALTAILGPVVLTVVSALTALAVVLAPLTAGMIALSSLLFLVGAGFAQIQDTQNSERLGRAFDNALARSVAPLESFVFQLMALAPVLELVMTGFNRLVGETLTDLPEVLFNAFKTVGLGALALAQAYQQAMITLNNVLSAMGVGFAGPGELEQTLDGLAEMYAELFDLTFSEALIQAATDTRILGEAATSTADALDRVTRNLPEGFKVANAAFQAASPELPGGTPFTSGVAEQGIVINGDLIVTGATDTGQLAQNILDAAGRDRFTNWGNSQVTGRYNWGGAN